MFCLISFSNNAFLSMKISQSINLNYYWFIIRTVVCSLLKLSLINQKTVFYRTILQNGIYTTGELSHWDHEWGNRERELLSLWTWSHLSLRRNERLLTMSKRFVNSSLDFLIIKTTFFDLVRFEQLSVVETVNFFFLLFFFCLFWII